MSRVAAAPQPTRQKHLEKPIIYELDSTGRTVQRFWRGRVLGKGGFAHVIQATDESGRQHAIKVIDKASLHKPKLVMKLQAEIEIHKLLGAHRHIVRFDHHFEDEHCHYIVMELCTKPSLMELHKAHGRMQPAEVRFFVWQLLNAVEYVHSRNIIHRDLKLGNIFLTSGYEMKVGDFGLAAQVAFPGERKQTMCGTPNYIAPEILSPMHPEGGHSFEVDVWSVGVILYTLLAGYPPFETKNIKATYRKIRDVSYRFPDPPIDPLARSLITRILQPSPTSRPSLADIALDPFFAMHPPMPLAPLSLFPPGPERDRQARALARIAPSHTPYQDQPDASSPTSPHTPAPMYAPCPSAMPGMRPPPPPHSSVPLHHYPPTHPQGEVGGMGGGMDVVADPSASPPLTRVIAFADWSSRYGLAYVLSSGVVGAWFNDSTKILINPALGLVEYFHPTDDSDAAAEAVERFEVANHPPQHKKKVALIDYFTKDFYDRPPATQEELDARASAIAAGGADAVAGDPPIIRCGASVTVPSSVDEAYRRGYDIRVYVKRWRMQDGALFMKLSNVSVQVVFPDGGELVLPLSGECVYYTEPGGQPELFSLSRDVCREHPQLYRRLRFAWSVLQRHSEFSDVDPADPP